ncbi:MAG: UPF0149 family protein, partial [Holosporaceae bacterium]|nr:UPF0149 family protein [Holosporaceae bacterium]
DSFPSEDSMTLEMLDGFFTALHCCSHLVPPSRCMHSIYGNESDDEVPFENEKQFYFLVQE